MDVETQPPVAPEGNTAPPPDAPAIHGDGAGAAAAAAAAAPDIAQAECHPLPTAQSLSTSQAGEEEPQPSPSPLPPPQNGEGSPAPPAEAEALAEAPVEEPAPPLPEPLEEEKLDQQAEWRPPRNEEDKRMLKCDHYGCPLWVHAQCERLSPEEYDLVCKDDNHPLSRSVTALPMHVCARVR